MSTPTVWANGFWFRTTNAASGFISGQVATFADLPAAGLYPGEFWLVTSASGVYLINRHPAGLYVSTGTSWVPAPDIVPFFSDANFRIYNDTTDSKQVSFDLSGLSASSTRTITMPDQSVDLTPGVTFAPPDDFIGDSGSGGTAGLVPAPGVGDATRYLKGDGSWAVLAGGDVVGPAGATGDNFAAFDAGTGKLIKDSGKSAADFDAAGTAATAVLGKVSVQGAINASTNPNYPAALKGDYYYISVAGKIGGASGATVEARDTITAIVDTVSGDHATVGTNWVIGQGNIVNAVTGSGSSVNARFPAYVGTSGTTIQDSGYSAASFDTAGAATAVQDNLNLQRTAQGEPTGFEDCDNIAVAYDSTAKTITLTRVGGINYWIGGTRYTLTSPWVSDAHTATNGVWYLSVKAGNVISWTQSVWNFATEAMIAFVSYNNPVTFGQREVHGLMPWQVHEELHQVQGTYWISGGTLSGHSVQPANPTDANNRPTYAAATIQDEDLESLIAATSTGAYTRLYFTTTGVVNLADTAQADLFRVGVTYPKINTWDGATFTETEAVNNRYFNYYSILVPVASDAGSQVYRRLILQPQNSYTSLTLAQAETFQNLYLGALGGTFPEYIAVSRITMRTSNTYSSTGKVRIEAVSYLTTTRSAVSAGTGAPSSSARVISMTIDGGGYALTTGLKTPFIAVPFQVASFTAWYLRITDAAGVDVTDSCTVDVYASTTYSGVLASIVGAGTKPAASSAAAATGTDFTSWTTTLQRGGWLALNVTAAPATATVLHFGIEVVAQ